MRHKTVTPCGKYYFDKKAADKAVRFFESMIIHIEGELAGQYLVLEKWQKEDIIRPAFGWKRVKDDKRRYTTIYLEIARKNGKSFLGVGFALYLLACDGEPGAKVYGAAADKDQAKLIFDVAKEVVAGVPKWQEKLTVHRNAISVKGKPCVYRPISADAYTKHGFNAHGIIFDEVHCQKNPELFETLETSTVSRVQPLTFCATTAGYDRTTFCYEMHEMALRVIEDPTVDPTMLAVIYAADPEDDWTSPKTWAKANPNLGVSVKLEYLEKKCAKAKLSPRFENTFKRLHLSIWTEQQQRWLSMDAWDNCQRFDPEELLHRPCIAGLDLASLFDMTALVLVFSNEDGTFSWLPFFWLPEDHVDEWTKRDNLPYREWAKNGQLRLTPGDVQDYTQIFEDIIGYEGPDGWVPGIVDLYYIREIAFDPYNATQLVTQLKHEGMEVTAHPQSFGKMSPPAKDFESLVIEGKIRHNSHEVLSWQARNVCVEEDRHGNIRPIKPPREARSKRVDGIIGGIMATGRSIAEGNGYESVYENRGIRVI